MNIKRVGERIVFGLYEESGLSRSLKRRGRARVLRASARCVAHLLRPLSIAAVDVFAPVSFQFVIVAGEPYTAPTADTVEEWNERGTSSASPRLTAMVPRSGEEALRDRDLSRPSLFVPTVVKVHILAMFLICILPPSDQCLGTCHSPEAFRQGLAGARHNSCATLPMAGDGAVTTLDCRRNNRLESSARIVLNLRRGEPLATASRWRRRHSAARRDKRLGGGGARRTNRHIEVAPKASARRCDRFTPRRVSTVGAGARIQLVTSDRRLWFETCQGRRRLPPSAFGVARGGDTFRAFVVGGWCARAVRLPVGRAFTSSALMTGVVFFLIGSIKSHWATASWWRSGLTTLLVGGVAAGLAYAAGVLLKNIAP